MAVYFTEFVLNLLKTDLGRATVVYGVFLSELIGEIEIRRRRKLVAEDVVEVGGNKLLVKDSVSPKKRG